ncbi:MAG TPA: TIGR02710 family CRISPR-associated CARF protein [Methylomirabilota bacterium]|nr:TIGR02710 family CRISPR-associated CARF protein [Methylomirabilota bacterium]
MPRGLIVSLGTGPGVENAIAKSIRHANPTDLMFIASETSLATLERVRTVLGRSLEDAERITADENDVEECYKATLNAIRLLQKKGLPASDIALDFTSGTKAMSAGLVLAAAAMEVGSVIYVYGRRGPDGRVISGTERVSSLDPLEPWIDVRAKLVREFFNLYQFNAALRLLEEMKERMHDEKARDAIDAACHLVQAYDAWDKFDHEKADGHFHEIKSLDQLQRWSIALQNNRSFLAALLKRKKRAQETKQLEDRFSFDLIVDLLLNAERRAQEGKFDDAVARLYRFTEMFAQALLAQHNIDTSEVDVRLVPETLREELEKSRNAETHRVEIPLAKSYALLAGLGNPAGSAFRHNKNLKNYLKRRNSSILAHGVEPITEKDYTELRQECEELLATAYPKWQESAARGRFARLELAG